MYIGNQHKIVYFTLIKKVYTNIASLHWELKVALYKQHLELNTCRSCSLGPGERHLGGKQAANGQRGPLHGGIKRTSPGHGLSFLPSLPSFLGEGVGRRPCFLRGWLGLSFCLSRCSRSQANPEALLAFSDLEEEESVAVR